MQTVQSLDISTWPSVLMLVTFKIMCHMMYTYYSYGNWASRRPWYDCHCYNLHGHVGWLYVHVLTVVLVFVNSLLKLAWIMLGTLPRTVQVHKLNRAFWPRDSFACTACPVLQPHAIAVWYAPISTSFKACKILCCVNKWPGWTCPLSLFPSCIWFHCRNEPACDAASSVTVVVNGTFWNEVCRHASFAHCPQSTVHWVSASHCVWVCLSCCVHRSRQAECMAGWQAGLLVLVHSVLQQMHVETWWRLKFFIAHTHVHYTCMHVYRHHVIY